ncbi:MAG: GNAT family N-acetyltransferase [Humidesulfovibrio sp.]|nr:GNAT family N-acetyltransferase [Desulfovibrio sp.]MDO9081938.1 GNAT family N-acetyltransferase [Humidesulfovibrio sp.]
MDEITMAGYVPGAIGRVAEMHALYYSRHWKFGLYFEARIAAGLAEFMQRFDPARDGFWTVSRAGRVQGSLAIDGAQAATEGAHLRWFILADELQGLGLGRRLLQEAMDFCGRCGHPRVFLWTFQGLAPARHLYESFGFRLAEEREGLQWGELVLEQRFVLELV